MDARLQGFSNEELMKAIVENAMIMFVETQGIELSDEDAKDIIDSVTQYNNGEIVDSVFERVHDELDKLDLFPEMEYEDECDDVDETNYNPYMGQDDLSDWYGHDD